MKKKSSIESGIFQPRFLLAFTLCSIGIGLAIFSLNAAPSSHIKARKTAAPTPVGAILSTSNRSITYMEPAGAQTPNATGVALGAPNCTVPTSCSTFNLTIDPSVGLAAGGYDPAQNQIRMTWQWSVATVDYDIFFEDAAGNVVAVNNSTADPSSIILPTTTAAGVYHIVIVLATGAPIGYNGTVVLEAKPLSAGLCNPNVTNCTPPRYMNYPAGPGQSDDAGEPSLGVDWNPNVASLKNTTSPIYTTGIMRLNTGGVAFFTSGPHEWRANFDDCPSPAVNVWEDVSAVTTQQFVLSDPIGFVDHYSSGQLGLSYPPPTTPGRVFSLDLIGGQGNSLGSFSDNDGNSYLPGGTGGPGAGPDHETIGGGPYNLTANPPPPPQTVAYGSPNAIYYCSQNIVAEAQCSRSDDGGQTFGPGVPIFSASQCTGGIHGHVKVAPDGTVYVPNASCGTVGTDGTAVSTDNGLTWTENNVPGTSGSQDPSVGIGQNNVGKPGGNLGGTNTVYLGYVDGNGHPYVSHSGDRGANWSTAVDVGISFGIERAVFPVVVAGDDNRAAFAFVGTGPGIATTGSCDPYGATLNCKNIWHLYVATTYDGGANWITMDATPNDPVQQGTVCLQGTTCAGGRNLLDFNDFAIDAEGRGLVGYADGCVNCGNTFAGQSAADHGTIARQSGGRRLFAHFDPAEPAVPASPQMVSAAIQSPGILVKWLEPDSGGSPITGYNIYRGTVSNAETFLAHVSGETNLQYYDATPPSGNAFYFAQAINSIGEGTHCGEVAKSVGGPVESECQVPGLTKLTDPAGDTSAALGVVNTPAPPGSDLLALQIAQPYQLDNIPRLVFTISTDNGQTPQPPGSAWYVAIHKSDGSYKGVHMAWYPTSPTTPTFESYTPGANQSGGVDGRFVTPGTQVAAEASSSYLPPYNKVIIVVKASDLGLNPGDTITGFVSAVSMSTDPGSIVGAGATALFDMMPDSLAYTGTYTVDNNQVCRPNNPPVPMLTATPMSGTAPLQVTLDGSASYDPDTAPPADTIASYTFDFGDGSPQVTQSTPTIQYTYTAAGDYPARLLVIDSRGKQSLGAAEADIHVTSGAIALSGVVSRKVHGASSTFDVVLPQPPPVGTTRGIECRTVGHLPNGAAGDYQMIFGFENPLTSVSGASVTTGTGSVSSSAIGTDPHQYIVNLSGVANAQYITVTLANVTDSTNATGNVTGTMGVLLGDTNADGSVNSADIGQTKSQSGTVLSGSNFREDVTLDANLNSADIGLVKSKSGTALPTTP